MRERLGIAKSAYYYRTDKARVSPRKEKDGERGALMLFLSKMQRYRRIKAALERAGRVISEKVIRRLMKALGLKVKGKRTRKCSSHAGEISPPAVKGFRRVTGTQEMPIS